MPGRSWVVAVGGALVVASLAVPAGASHSPASCEWEYGGVAEIDPAPCVTTTTAGATTTTGPSSTTTIAVRVVNGNFAPVPVDIRSYRGDGAYADDWRTELLFGGAFLLFFMGMVAALAMRRTGK